VLSSRGAYYVMTDISAFRFSQEVTLPAIFERKSIACVRERVLFYKHPKDGSKQVRFRIRKKPETLAEPGDGCDDAPRF